MRTTPTQTKAIEWYCKHHDLVPQLSTHPVYYFRDRQGTESKRHIAHIVREFEAYKASDKKRGAL